MARGCGSVNRRNATPMPVVAKRQLQQPISLSFSILQTENQMFTRVWLVRASLPASRGDIKCEIIVKLYGFHLLSTFVCQRDVTPCSLAALLLRCLLHYSLQHVFCKRLSMNLSTNLVASFGCANCAYLAFLYPYDIPSLSSLKALVFCG